MTGLSWFRMYVDFLEDPKMISLAFEDQRHFIGILALKASGILDQECEARVMDRLVAQKLWIDFAIIDDIKKRLVNAKLITDDWQPIAWEKRQFQSDSSAERTRKYRERKKKEEGQRHSDDGCDDSVTEAKRHSDALDTDTDTDTEEEKTICPSIEIEEPQSDGIDATQDDAKQTVPASASSESPHNGKRYTWDTAPNHYKLERIFEYLNTVDGREGRSEFQVKSPNGKLTTGADFCLQRIKDGWTWQDFKAVIVHQHRDTSRKDETRRYYNPETIFRKRNFERILDHAKTEEAA